MGIVVLAAGTADHDGGCSKLLTAEATSRSCGYASCEAGTADGKTWLVQEGATMNETGWLIESEMNGSPVWYCGPIGINEIAWTINASEAIRFCRKIDAEKALGAIGLKGWCVITEHEWCDRPTDEEIAQERIRR